MTEPNFTEEQLRAFREIGLVLDFEGRFWHQGQRVAHPRLHKALLSWMAVGQDGRFIVRLDDKRFAYVDVADAPLRIISAQWQGSSLLMVLDDGEAETLVEPEFSYRQSSGGGPDALYAKVRYGTMTARFLPSAAASILAAVESTGAEGSPASGALTQWWVQSPDGRRFALHVFAGG